jgi:uncharacterized membrane protein HdeD (DUF308 family)
MLQTIIYNIMFIALLVFCAFLFIKGLRLILKAVDQHVPPTTAAWTLFAAGLLAALLVLIAFDLLKGPTESRLISAINRMIDYVSENPTKIIAGITIVFAIFFVATALIALINVLMGRREAGQTYGQIAGVFFMACFVLWAALELTQPLENSEILSAIKNTVHDFFSKPLSPFQP